MTDITLKAKSRKGKNRIRENGDKCTLVETGCRVHCLADKPGMLVKHKKNNSLRWICLTNDPNFEIISSNN